MGVVKSKDLSQKDKHNWKVLDLRIREQSLWYSWEGVNWKLVGSEFRSGKWYWVVRDEGFDYRYVDRVLFEGQAKFLGATPL